MPSFLFFLSALAAASLVHAQSVPKPCPNFHIIVARGSDEAPGESTPPNEGYSVHVIDAICAKVRLNFRSTAAE